MGNFGGHSIPGSFFFAIGLWQTVQAFRRYYQCRNSKEKFKSSTWYPVGSCCQQLTEFPVEPCVKVLMCLLGFIVEITHADYVNGIFHDPMNEQHMTMYVFFGLNGVLEILTHFNLTFSVNVNHISFALAYFVEFVLFKFHLHGRTGVDNLVHILLLYVICASIFAVIYMMRYPSHILASLMHGFCLLLQGTWFWEIAFVLYNPVHGAQKWHEDSHDDMMVVTCHFAWHFGVLLLSVLLISWIISYFNSLFHESLNRTEMSTQKLIPNGNCGYHDDMYVIEEEDESD